MKQRRRLVLALRANLSGRAALLLKPARESSPNGQIYDELLGALCARDHVAAGGQMSYNASYAWRWRCAAGFVDKVLKGEKPGDLPVQQATQFELAINLKSAKAIGIAIPRSLLQRANEVIE